MAILSLSTTWVQWSVLCDSLSRLWSPVIQSDSNLGVVMQVFYRCDKNLYPLTSGKGDLHNLGGSDLIS